MSAASARFLSATVLPPVLGPVTTIARVAGETWYDCGTTPPGTGSEAADGQARSGWQ